MKKYPPIFITATNTNIGKTYTTLKLLEALSANKFQDLTNQSFGRLTVLYKDNLHMLEVQKEYVYHIRLQLVLPFYQKL